MNEPLIVAENVSMRYYMPRKKIKKIWEYIVYAVRNEIDFQEFWALKDVSFQVCRGEALGVIGQNGAGKTTLMRILAKVLWPTTGNVQIKGNVVPLLEMGAGFDNELTGQENILLYGTMLGYSSALLREQTAEILRFAEVENFADTPLKNYSSGMRARLGFSIATFAAPDILIADEALSAGDIQFRKKCEMRIDELIAKGTTVVIVTHSMQEIQRICTKALLLEKGKMVYYGKINKQ